MIELVGIITGKADKSKEIISSIKNAFSELPNVSSPPAGGAVRTCYLIWNDPYMTVGGDTFIHAMLKACGFKNIFSHKTRYPEVTIKELTNAQCQLLLLSSEPFPFKQKHVDHLQLLLPGTKILLVDGEMFSWYGSHLLHAPAYFKEVYDRINKA